MVAGADHITEVLRSLVAHVFDMYDIVLDKEISQVTLVQ